MIKAGIFGIQAHTGKFIDLLKKNGAQVTVFWNDEIEKGEKAAAEYSIPFEKDCLKAMDDYGINAVIITAYAYLHCRLICEAAKRGLHIFLEKPLCVSSEDAKIILKALNSSNGKFYMSDPFIRSQSIAMKHLKEEGRLGEISSAYFRIGSMKNFDHFDLVKQQGGILSDIGLHGLHMIRYLFGKPSSFLVNAQDLTGHHAEDNVSIIFSYPSGCQVVYQASWLSAGNTNRAVLYGTKGFVFAEASTETPGLSRFCYVDGEKGVMDYELPKEPMEHIDFFVKMINEDLDNEMVGIDEDSLQIGRASCRERV